MDNVKKTLVTALIAVAAIAVISRIASVRNLVFNNPA